MVPLVLPLVVVHDKTNTSVMKYVLKESELVSIFETIIKEELDNALNEGIGKTLWNTVKGAAHLAISPYTAVAGGMDKIDKYFSGERVGSTGGSSGGNGSGSNSSTSKNNSRSRSRENRPREFHTRNQVIREYGEPATVGFMGRRLERRQPVRVENFLGSGQAVNFGRHYVERNQDDAGSVWNARLDRAAANIAAAGGNPRRNIRQYRRLVDEWLNERDVAYEQYVKLPRGGALAF